MGQQKNTCAWGLEKNCDIFTWLDHFLLPFSVWWWGDFPSLKQAKIDLKKEKIRFLNDVWKDYLKIWDRWNSQPLDHTGGAYSAPYEPPHARANVRFVLFIFSMFIFLLVFQKSTIHLTLKLWSKWIPWGLYIRETVFLCRIYWFEEYCPKLQGELISRGNLIMYYRPTTIKLNPWWKNEVSKSVWIKPSKGSTCRN